MKRFFILMAILPLTLFSFSKETYYEAQVFFNNGTSRLGQFNYVNTDNSKYIFVKSELNLQPEKISTDSIKSIIYSIENEKIEFGFLKVYTGWKQTKISTPNWLQLIVKGPVSLYFFNSSVSGPTPASVGQFQTSVTFTNYYVIREGEPAAKLYSITASANNNQTFRAKAPLYFADYPELAEKIRNKEYTWKNQVEVVNIYNEWVLKNRK